MKTMTVPRTASLRIASPVGTLLLEARGGALVGILFDPGPRGPRGEDAATEPVLAEAARQLGAYFDGRLREFDLPLAPEGTEFQLLVWNALAAIPYGRTESYGELARRIDRPSAVRAVGAANGANPLPLVLPCHRVVGSDGSLTGYGGGLERKAFLLRLEGARLD